MARRDDRRISRRRGRVEAAVAAVFVVATILTAVWPDWIEGVTGADPDHGDGSVEWAFIAALGLVAVVMSLVSVRNLRAARA